MLHVSVDRELARRGCQPAIDALELRERLFLSRARTVLAPIRAHLSGTTLAFSSTFSGARYDVGLDSEIAAQRAETLLLESGLLTDTVISRGLGGWTVSGRVPDEVLA